MAEFTTVDYLAQAIARETSPFNGDVSFETILTLLLQEPSELQTAIGSLKEYVSIDTAYGDGLDVIGDIVGQERVLPANAGDIGLLTYFGFDGAENAETFGDLDNTALGASFVDQNQIDGGVITLSDDAYRFFIRAKIISNTTKATPEEVMSAAAFLFDLPSIAYSESNANIFLGLGRKLDETSGTYSSDINERLVAYEYIPKPAGVGLFLYDYDPDNVFGFEGDNGSLGFGDLTDSTVGGTFAELF